MLLSFVFVCLCYYLTIVESNNGERFYRANKMPEIEKIHGYEYGIQKFYSYINVHNRIEANCKNKTFTHSFKQSKAKGKCQPRDVVVHLKSNFNDFTMMPNQVVVKRCYESGCYGKNSCAPVDSELISIPVYISRYRNDGVETQCSWVNVTEHTSCKCKCLVKREDCNDMQDYIPSDCMCRCNNQQEKKMCNAEGMLWNENTCSCDCYSRIMECSTGFEWIPRMCKCLRVLMPNIENSDYEKYSLVK